MADGVSAKKSNQNFTKNYCLANGLLPQNSITPNSLFPDILKETLNSLRVKHRKNYNQKAEYKFTKFDNIAQWLL